MMENGDTTSPYFIERRRIRRQRWKNRQHGIGSMIFLLGIIFAIVGITITIVEYQGFKESLPEFRIIGPFFLTLAIIFLFGGLILTGSCNRNCCQSRPNEEMLQLQEQFLSPRKKKNEKLTDLKREMSNFSDVCRPEDSVFVHVDCREDSERRKFSLESISSYLIRLNPKVEPEPDTTEDLTGCEHKSV